MSGTSDLRYTSGGLNNGKEFVVIEGNHESYNKASNVEKEKMIVVQIKASGTMSPKLAKIYVEQICNQLNGFDVANATVAKLTG